MVYVLPKHMGSTTGVISSMYSVLNAADVNLIEVMRITSKQQAPHVIGMMGVLCSYKA